MNRPVEVVNTGVAGLRAEQILTTFETAAEFHPDLMIILTGINDWNHHIRLHFGVLHRWPRLDFTNSPLATVLRGIWHTVAPPCRPFGAGPDSTCNSPQQSGTSAEVALAKADPPP